MRKWLVEETETRCPRMGEQYWNDEKAIMFSHIDFEIKKYPILKVTELSDDPIQTHPFDEWVW